MSSLRNFSIYSPTHLILFAALAGMFALLVWAGCEHALAPEDSEDEAVTETEPVEEEEVVYQPLSREELEEMLQKNPTFEERYKFYGETRWSYPWPGCQQVMCDNRHQAPSWCCEATMALGEPLWPFWHTYYYLADESSFSSDRRAKIKSKKCGVISSTSKAFADSVCIQGSGRLEDGRIINVATDCACGTTCPTGGKVCYSVLNPELYPWGRGANGQTLEPLRSIAVDRGTVPLGTVIYLQEWDGYKVPEDENGIGGFIHDGCFRADDVGGWIKGSHIDIFAGTRELWQRLEQDFPTGMRYTTYLDHPPCAYLTAQQGE